jgi:LmbE family N-acetylglucosaminyl deacetylase
MHRRIWQPGLPLAALLLCASMTAATAARPPAADALATILPAFPPPLPTDRVLVVAPHPDDESLCCAGLIQQALARGATVGIVWVTDGDGFEIDAILMEHTLRPHGAASRRLGAQRLNEAHAAADLLGVARRHQYVLGYPDRDLRALLGAHFTQPLRSTYTRVSAVATAEARSPGAAYTGANLTRDLAGVLDEFAPTLVLAATPQDLHSDHAASGELVARLLAARGQSSRLRWWIVHAGRNWPAPRRYRPALALSVLAVSAAQCRTIATETGSHRPSPHADRSDEAVPARLRAAQRVVRPAAMTKN